MWGFWPLVWCSFSSPLLVPTIRGSRGYHFGKSLGKNLVFAETSSLKRYFVGFALSLAQGILWVGNHCHPPRTMFQVPNPRELLGALPHTLLCMLFSSPKAKERELFLYCSQSAWVDECEIKFFGKDPWAGEHASCMWYSGIFALGSFLVAFMLSGGIQLFTQT